MLAVLSNGPQTLLMPDPKSSETIPPTPSRPRRPTEAQLAAVVEAAYVLEAVRR